jgi:hypothetical protein
MAAYEPPTQSVPIFDSALFTKEEVDTAEISTTAKNVLFTSDNSNQNCFIPFVKSSGTGTKPLFIDDTTTPITINPNTGDIRMIGLKNDVANGNVSLGIRAGITQGGSCLAIGTDSGATSQGQFSVGIGQEAGQNNQSVRSVAIGFVAGKTSQGNDCVAIGQGAGSVSQGAEAVAIGVNAGRLVAQGARSVIIGGEACRNGQLTDAVAIGYAAGKGTENSTATRQGQYAVAIGRQAGEFTQGTNAIAIGYLAGQTSQTQNSIALNASGSALNPTEQGLFVRPVRGVARGLGVGVLHYDTSTYEITYSTD